MDFVEAYKWFDLAAEQGSPEAKRNRDLAELAMSEEEIADAQRRAREWRPVEEKVEVAPMRLVSVAVRDGISAAHRGDHVMALNLWRPVAEKGDADAQISLGLAYYFGKGARRDYAEAAKWYGLAAQQGNASAQASLGTLYEAGLGVMRDYAVAYMWFDLAAAQNGENAAQARDLVAQKMTPQQLVQARRLGQDWKPTITH
jgi:TPR repeat protein